jgi:hypothetical protein
LPQSPPNSRSDNSPNSASIQSSLIMLLMPR